MPTILIDGNNLAIRILLAIPGYSAQFNSSHQENLFIYSFFNIFLNTCNKIKKKYEINNIVFVWDSKINNRKKIYPNYKANRKPKTLLEENDKINHYCILDILKENLKTLGEWGCVEQEGFEADDIIAYFVKESSYDNQFIIVSSDNDLYQLLGQRVIQYLPNRKEFYTYIDFEKEFGIIPDKYPFVKALAGDTSDNIKGVTGIGIKRGIKLIQENKCWTHWLEKYPNIDLETNLELIRLPFQSKKINIKIPQCYFDKNAFIEIFQKFSLSKLSTFDFKTLLDK